MNRIGLLYALLVVSNMALGQSFGFRAAMDTVPRDGFYQIFLPPIVLGHLNTDLSDIRLYDRAQQEVPYLLSREKPVEYQTLFRPYTIVSQTSRPKVGTSLVLRNEAHNPINNLSLVIKNANVRKKARLSGSNDAQQWYVIEENYPLEAPYSATSTSEVQIMGFPLSDYEYYRLDLNDSLGAPLNILRVGYYDTHPENGKYTDLKDVSFSQRDSAAVKQTYLRVSLPTATLMDKISFTIAKPAYFHRQATVGVWEVIKKKRGKTRRVFVPVSTFTLRSSGENAVSLAHFKAQEFYVLIDNEDNPPLVVQEVQAYQLRTHLVAQLQKGQSYELGFGDPSLGFPSYDLAYFKDSIPATLPTLSVQAVTAAVPAADTPPTIFTNRSFLWIALALVLAILLYASFHMVRDMGKK